MKKVAIITGASEGIGRSTAVLFASKGYAIAIVARSEDNLKLTKAECVKVLIIVGSLTDPAISQKVVAETIAEFGQLDVLVNNAGFNVMGPLVTATDDLFDKQFDLNVKSVMRLTSVAVPHLAKTKGTIVNVSSIAAVRAAPPFGLYCMSKAALDMYTKCLALELASTGIRVNSVNPGLVMTNFAANNGVCSLEQQSAALDSMQKSYPLGRGGAPEEVASAILFFAGADSSFATGSVLILDGGKTLGDSLSRRAANTHSA